MFGLLHDRLDGIVRIGGDAVLQNGSKGMEKESLRVTPDGSLSTAPHPRSLGSALTHPWITTDFSEALIELVTPPFQTSWETLQYLCDLHQFVYERIGDEMLWATSMPCAVSGDESIPIAEYGDSNSGRMKHVYRQGLSHRYGRVMQAIAGVHFNYSLPGSFWEFYRAGEESEVPMRAFRDDAYFGLLRNYRRFGWLVLYLFGASPAVCKSFLRGRQVDLPEWDPWTVYGRYSTTLRMSDLGYRNANQAGVNPSMNTLEAYVADLDRAIRTPFAEYEAIGKRVDGQWRQLSTSVLQIENEYYGFIRPKQVARSGERPTRALQRRGVEYVEVRSLDVSPLDPVGVSQNEMRFLEALLILCLLSDSPPMTDAEARACDANHLAVAVRGRDPELGLTVGGRTRSLRDWGVEIMDSLRPICQLLDAGTEQGCYRASLEHQLAKVLDSAETPSARVLAAMADRELSFFEFAADLSRRYRDYFRNLPPIEPARRELFEQEAADSLSRYREIEDSEEMPFEEFLERYYSG
jgi:glutamate--cysteine ligase